MIPKNKVYTIINFFVSILNRNSSLYQFYYINFWINMIFFVSAFY